MTDLREPRMDGPTACHLCGEEVAGPYDLEVHLWDAHEHSEPPKTSRRLLGTLAAVVLAYLAIGGFLIVDWGAMLSGSSARVQHEVETGSGAWTILAPLLAYAAYRVAKWSWR